MEFGLSLSESEINWIAVHLILQRSLIIDFNKVFPERQHFGENNTADLFVQKWKLNLKQETGICMNGEKKWMTGRDKNTHQKREKKKKNLLHPSEKKNHKMPILVVWNKQ